MIFIAILSWVLQYLYNKPSSGAVFLFVKFESKFHSAELSSSLKYGFKLSYAFWIR